MPKSTSRSKRRISKHKCVWKMTDHEYRTALRCKICRREKTRLSGGRYKYH